MVSTEGGRLMFKLANKKFTSCHQFCWSSLIYDDLGPSLEVPEDVEEVDFVGELGCGSRTKRIKQERKSL
ncbi:hypothetical protein NC653_016466 [Populus alba x Populus x berolinensis]|uniref:Uncharacterized protein n=1 Tax=Populus alba x Populus x berolinensis TaxID=444605 RepID=A0AAD6VZ87_9ROSI|nr:hypothetical protein NC653_016466 [Populus alba x Populus x berolinensis]